jgi:uncharacterized protein YjiK/methionine-rich copper-binding protein CopC
MRTVRSKFPLTLLSTAVVVALAACGGSDDESAPAPVALPTLGFTAPQQTIDIANYRFIDAYNLPVSSTGNQQAQEASGIAYNKDTDSLFIVGDEGTGVVEVGKTGLFKSGMSLAGSDVEGIAYLGGGVFAYVEERERSINRFTYAAGTVVPTLQTVKLGPSVDNIGIEGISWDPATSGFVGVKEINPQGVFETKIDFTAGTATNGNATTAPTDKFDPAKIGLPSLNDVFALSNVLASTTTSYNQLLIISASSDGVRETRVAQMDRDGNRSGLLEIGQAQNEGLTMDGDRNLYTVNENGGGVGVPQMMVFSPTTSASAVGKSSNLYLNFDQAVSAGTGNLMLSNGAGDTRTIAVTDTQQVTFRGNTVVVNPTLDLWPGRTYNITWSAGVVKNAAGGTVPAVSSTTQFAFTVHGAIDNAAPTLASSLPADEARRIDAAASISLVFSEKVLPGTGNITLDNGAGDVRTIAIGSNEVKFGGRTVIVTPATPLVRETTYTVKVAATAVLDTAGNAYAGISSATALNFTVAPTPTVLQPGDVRFLAVNGDAVDAVAFILLKPVREGTTIGITDRNYPSFDSGESAYAWIADTDYPAGTIVTIRPDPVVLADKGIVQGAGGGISTTAETVYAFQGSIADLTASSAGAITVQRFLAAINVGGLAAGTIPAEVNPSGTLVSFPLDNVKYTGPLDISDLAVFIANLNNGANWTSSDTVSFTLDANGSLYP